MTTVSDKHIHEQLMKDASLNPVLVEVTDTSGGCGSMFVVTIVSDAFQGVMPIKRHRMVHTILEKEIGKIHAITLSLFSVSQYKAKNPEWVQPPPPPQTKLDSASAVTPVIDASQLTAAPGSVPLLPPLPRAA
ncbi:hypothetical protein IWW39_004339 [Coemansia spiralis]|uniref:BolA-like protein n=1 Tax=Coemansia spiralis TaxID=417178 RepID=A0A9W8L3R3_9FUNG|nr:hypothetical protein IWW39_004339 [Coemansia spiralis]